MGDAPAARILGLFKQAMTVPESKERSSLLDAIEAWVYEQLPRWEDQPFTEGEMSESFNESLSAGADGLHLALEVVELLRVSDANQLVLIEQLLGQVNDYFQTARQCLLEAEPYPDEEKP